MNSLPLTSLVTLLVLILLSLTAFNVGRARGRYGVKAPAVSGHEMFERAFRVQMNTLEGVVLMLRRSGSMPHSSTTAAPGSWV